jgi:hypothetical protein
MSTSNMPLAMPGCLSHFALIGYSERAEAAVIENHPVVR